VGKENGARGKNRTHYYVYMVGSEKADNNTRGDAAESEKRTPKKPKPMRNIIMV
jgi:hypothetical protein